MQAHSYQRGPNAVQILAGLNNLPSPEDRIHDLLLDHRFHIVNEEVYAPPAEGFRPGTLPREESIETPFLSFRTAHVREGDSVRARLELTLKQDRIGKEDYETFYEEVQEVIKKSSWQVVFKRVKIDEKGEALEEMVKNNPEDPVSLLNLARHYLTKGKYAEAGELMEKAAAMDTSNGEVHYFLGVAYGYLDQYDKARVEFARAKELGYKS